MVEIVIEGNVDDLKKFEDAMVEDRKRERTLDETCLAKNIRYEIIREKYLGAYSGFSIGYSTSYQDEFNDQFGAAMGVQLDMKKSMDGMMNTYTEDRNDQELEDLAAYWASKEK